MATTVSERPQTRQSVTHIRPKHLAVLIMFVSLSFIGLQSGRGRLAAITVVMVLMLLWIEGLPRLRQRRHRDDDGLTYVPPRGSIRPFDHRQADWPTRIGLWGRRHVDASHTASAELWVCATDFVWPYLRYRGTQLRRDGVPAMIHGAGRLIDAALQHRIVAWICFSGLVLVILNLVNYTATDPFDPLFVSGGTILLLLVIPGLSYTINLFFTEEPGGGEGMTTMPRTASPFASTTGNGDGDTTTPPSDDGVERTTEVPIDRRGAANWSGVPPTVDTPTTQGGDEDTEPVDMLGMFARQDREESVATPAADPTDLFGTAFAGIIDDDVMGIADAVREAPPIFVDEVEDQRPLPSMVEAEETDGIIRAPKYWLSLWWPIAGTVLSFLVMSWSYHFVAETSSRALMFLSAATACLLFVAIPVARQISQVNDYLKEKFLPDDVEEATWRQVVGYNSRQMVRSLKAIVIVLVAIAGIALLWTIGLRPHHLWMVLQPVLTGLQNFFFWWTDSLPNFMIVVFSVAAIQMGLTYWEWRIRPLEVHLDKLVIPNGLLDKEGRAVRFEHISDFKVRGFIFFKWVTVTYNTPETKQAVRREAWIPRWLAKTIDERMSEL